MGPRLADPASARLAVERGSVFAATDREVLRLDATGRGWVTVAHGGADDLVVDGNEFYAASASRGSIMKVMTTVPGATPTFIGFSTKPYAITLDATTLFVVEETPFVIKQVVPR